MTDPDRAEPEVSPSVALGSAFRRGPRPRRHDAGRGGRRAALGRRRGRCDRGRSLRRSADAAVCPGLRAQLRPYSRPRCRRFGAALRRSRRGPPRTEQRRAAAPRVAQSGAGVAPAGIGIRRHRCGSAHRLGSGVVDGVARTGLAVPVPRRRIGCTADGARHDSAAGHGVAGKPAERIPVAEGGRHHRR